MDFEQRIERRIDDLTTALNSLALTVQEIRVGMIPRAEVYAEDAKRVGLETYQIAHQALQTEVNDLERDVHAMQMRSQNGLQRAAPWVAIGVSMFFGFTTFATSVAALIIALIAH